MPIYQPVRGSRIAPDFLSTIPPVFGSISVPSCCVTSPVSGSTEDPDDGDEEGWFAEGLEDDCWEDGLPEEPSGLACEEPDDEEPA